MDPSHHSPPARALALLLAPLIATAGCLPKPGQSPSAGLLQYQRAALVPVPGGFVNAAGGNLLIERLDLSIDTILGTQEIRAIYNAASGAWLWNFQMAYDGASFLDPTGALLDASGVASGQAIPGSVWVVVDTDTIRTKGGLGYHFDALGRLDHAGWMGADYPRIRYSWSAAGVELASCASAASCLPFYAIELGSGGDPTRITELRTGRTADFQYDALGRLSVARDPQAVEADWPGWRYEYSLGGTLLEAATNSEGERVEYRYQADRRIRTVTQVGEGNPSHVFSFTAAGPNFVTLHVNPLDGLTRYTVDPQRRLLAVERATGERTHWTWQGRRPTSRTLPDGATTQFTYVADDVETIVQASGNVVHFSYQPGGLNFEDPWAPALAGVWDTLGPIQQRSYDAQGRVRTISDGEGETFTSSYTQSTLDTLTNPRGAQVRFPLYGIHGHWTDMQGDAEDQRSFDPVGNVQVPSVVRQPGGVLSRGHDGNRNLTFLAVAASAGGHVTGQGSVAIARRSDGRAATVARPGGADHDFVYDALGRLAERRERVDGVWRTTSFTYDAAGHLTSRTLPNGMRQEWQYDAFGRLERHRTLRDGSLEGEALYSYQQGQLVAYYDSLRSATEVYGYDSAGRLATVVFGFGESGTLEYDLRSRLAAETLSLPGQGAIRRLDYAYDLADRPTRVTADAGELLAEWTYANGELETTRYGNGLRRDFAFDAVSGELVAATTTDALAAVVETTAVTRSAEIGPPRQQMAVQVATPLASTHEEYWLGLGGSLATPDQFVGKRVFGWNDGNGGSQSYAHDALSNRVDDAGGNVFGYNAEGNRLLEASLPGANVSLAYGYDTAGYAISRGGVPLAWTASGRLASFGSTAIAWDLRGRPISSTVEGVSRDFVFFGGRVDSDPATGALGSLDLGFVALPFGGDQRTYRHFDFRGNVSFVSDENGAVVSHYRYAPYGVDAVFGDTSDPVRFAGRAEIGELMWLGARIYDPAVGRFLSPDPVFQTLNAYAYTLGNPVWFWDPDGAQASEAGGGKARMRAALGLAASTLVLVGVGAGAAGNAPLAAAAFVTAAVIDVALKLDAFLDVEAGAGEPSSRLVGSSPRGAGGVPGGAFRGPTGDPVAAPELARPVTCAPRALPDAPHLPVVLILLVGVQLALGGSLLHRRRTRRRTTP